MGKEKRYGYGIIRDAARCSPQNILIAFDDKPAKSLADHVKEQQEQARQKKRRPRDDRER